MTDVRGERSGGLSAELRVQAKGSRRNGRIWILLRLDFGFVLLRLNLGFRWDSQVKVDWITKESLQNEKWAVDQRPRASAKEELLMEIKIE